jgi:hypothetical protein
MANKVDVKYYDELVGAKVYWFGLAKAKELQA